MCVTRHRGSSAIVPSCLRGYFVGPKFFLVGVSWVRIFFLCRYFLGSKVFLAGVSWVQNFFSWIFHEFKISPRGYFVSSNFFLVGISWVRNFFSLVFLVGPIFVLLANSWFKDYSIAGYMRKCDRKHKYRNTFHTTHSFSNRFRQLSIACIRKVLHLLNY